MAPADLFTFPDLLQWLTFVKEKTLITYSGGTVRDSHPVILFSSGGSSPRLPRTVLQFVKEIVAYAGAGCQHPQQKIRANRQARMPGHMELPLLQVL